MYRLVRYALLVLLVVAAVAAPRAARSETRSNARPTNAKGGPANDSDARAPTPYRARMGYADLYIPTFFQAERGAYDIVFHFHGVPNLQEDNVERSRLNAVVVSVT